MSLLDNCFANNKRLALIVWFYVLYAVVIPPLISEESITVTMEIDPSNTYFHFQANIVSI